MQLGVSEEVFINHDADFRRKVEESKGFVLMCCLLSATKAELLARRHIEVHHACRVEGKKVATTSLCAGGDTTAAHMTGCMQRACEFHV